MVHAEDEYSLLHVRSRGHVYGLAPALIQKALERLHGWGQIRPIKSGASG